MTATCRSCGAPIIWRRTPTGGRIPLDADPRPNDGNVLDYGDELAIVVLSHAGLVPLDAAPGGTLRVSHFATCPDAAKHRRKKGGGS